MNIKIGQVFNHPETLEGLRVVKHTRHGVWGCQGFVKSKDPKRKVFFQDDFTTKELILFGKRTIKK